MTDKQIEQEGQAIFGEFKLSEVRESLPAYLDRLKTTGTEMDKFTQSLPDWLTDAQIWDLWTMREEDRKAWLEANKPIDMTKSVYFQRTVGHKVELAKIGNIRF